MSGMALVAYPCRQPTCPSPATEEDPGGLVPTSPAAGAPANRPTPGTTSCILSSLSQSRRGVEAFLEPKTTVTETTVLLIAHDGEWTRRRVPSVEAARTWGNRVGIPVYDVALVGYPKRMREFNERRKRAESS